MRRATRFRYELMQFGPCKSELRQEIACLALLEVSAKQRPLCTPSAQQGSTLESSPNKDMIFRPQP